MIQSVQRAILLLNEIARRGGKTGVRELARACHLKVPTAQNLLKTLAATGYLDFDKESHRYSVGLAVVHLSSGIDIIRRSGAFARPFLEEFFGEVNETVVSSIFYRNRLILTDWIQAKHYLAAVHFDAIVEHPHLLASGKALLCYLDEQTQRSYAEQQPLGSLPVGTPHTVEDLLADLRRTRERGYGEIFNEGGNGIAALGVPVWGLAGQPVMAIGCSAPVARFYRQRLDEVRVKLLALAERMSAQLGSVLKSEHKDTKTQRHEELKVQD